ncbi:LytR family transcriptional regulator [Terrilactibacillus sp. BCM23-1]|uniref:Regulatory protein MsrR n=1 Tax=Terrilactibacillus tamarindi TaxID=2599694 RepID=A0A6N8CTN2_9BACI|nr:LCP family protein [Terrilactibacillus tamarindi]MTT32597.1 LytR family transcriptional regulator [Terrilactibacillus tamarindi]
MQQLRQNKRRRRLKKKYAVLLVVIIFFLIFFGYGYAQYHDGKKTSEPKSEENIRFNGEKDKNGNVNVLLLGIDKRKGETKSRTDSMMVAQYNPDNGKVKMVSLMRDMFVPIPGYSEYKLNTAYYLGGPELLRKTLKQEFNINIQYYVMVDFTGFEKIIDTLEPNGIEINVEKDMSKNIGVTLHEGEQKLNGKELLGYARFRHDAEGDFGRVRRQQQVLQTVADELISTNGVLKAPKLIGTIEPYIHTNIGNVDRIGLVKDFLFKHPKEIERLTLPVANSYENVRTVDSGLVLQIDQQKNQQALHDFLND